MKVKDHTSFVLENTRVDEDGPSPNKELVGDTMRSEVEFMANDDQNVNQYAINFAGTLGPIP
jgi:hypothetical protein